MSLVRRDREGFAANEGLKEGPPSVGLVDAPEGVGQPDRMVLRDSQAREGGPVSVAPQVKDEAALRVRLVPRDSVVPRVLRA